MVIVTPLLLLLPSCVDGNRRVTCYHSVTFVTILLLFCYQGNNFNLELTPSGVSDKPLYDRLLKVWEVLPPRE